MNAKEARKRTDEALEHDKGIEEDLKLIYERIAKEASIGNNVLYNLTTKNNTYDYRYKDRIRNALKKQGYTFHREEGDRPCDSPSEWISW